MKNKYFTKVTKVIKNPLWIIVFLNNRGLHIINDKNYIKLLYKLKFNKKINLNNPKTFNEKLQWLKLNDRKTIYTTMVDKYEVKKYVEKIIGEQYIIPTYGIYNNFKQIDFDKLPKEFVIKATHYGGNNGVYVVKNKEKFNTKTCEKGIKKVLNKNLYYSSREWPYKNVKPRIIIEKYIGTKTVGDVNDYKFFCFNGTVKCFKIDFNRTSCHQANYYDRNGNILPFGEVAYPPDYNKDIKLPFNLKEMIKLAEKLSKKLTFLRVDFYETNKKIYFGELTLYPASGLGKFTDESWDKQLGEWLKINEREQ